MRDVLIKNCWSLIYNEWGKISRHADIMPCSKYLTTIWVGRLGKQTQHPRGNHRPCNNHPLLPSLRKTHTRVATSKVRYFRGTVTRLGCAHKSAQGEKLEGLPPRWYSPQSPTDYSIYIWKEVSSTSATQQTLCGFPGASLDWNKFGRDTHRPSPRQRHRTWRITFTASVVSA